ncbi:MAG: hypothetical protein KME18_07710 [Phormidium tanganyikae FI6-MK23]|jgi:hypothetical protein|nr:hypothetical protein [Phormidium tanganyikae FI6-MK23]
MADYEQPVLFDLASYNSQQISVEEKALDIRKVGSLEQIEGKQLELNLFPQRSDEIP